MTFPYSTIDGLCVYDIPEDICQQMLAKVKVVRQNSFPQPNKVGAIVLTPDYQMFDGVSYHTQIMSLTMHAEATALAHAAIHGHIEIIAITGPNCHACKQLIWEHSLQSGIDITVIMKQDSQLLRVPISRMMQYAWPENPHQNNR